jgi:hypothetical protein
VVLRRPHPGPGPYIPPARRPRTGPVSEAKSFRRTRSSRSPNRPPLTRPPAIDRQRKRASLHTSSHPPRRTARTPASAEADNVAASPRRNQQPPRRQRIVTPQQAPDRGRAGRRRGGAISGGTPSGGRWQHVRRGLERRPSRLRRHHHRCGGEYAAHVIPCVLWRGPDLTAARRRHVDHRRICVEKTEIEPGLAVH